MIIGVPREIKVGEGRVAATPAGVSMLVKAGHEVLVGRDAGEGSGFTNAEYEDAGAKIVSKPDEAWKADLVLKVKEPLKPEFKFFREGLILFTYLHLANPGLRELTENLMDKGVTAIAYETVQLPDGSLPLLEPMSMIAGKMAIQVAAHFLERTHGGRGVLMSGVPGVELCNVVIIGAGTVGWNAAQTALGMGANVIVLDRGVAKLRRLAETIGLIHPGNLTTLASNPHNLRKALREADVVIGAVLTPGARAPILVTRDMIKEMKRGSVIIDVSIDQGGIFETSRPTTHENPVYEEEGVIHYCVANMPGAVPRTSTIALTNVTAPYALELANLGFIEAVRKNKALAKGVNTYAGYITNPRVAEAHGLEYKPLEELI